MIDREEFLKLASTPHKVLFLPADAGQVEIRSLTAGEMIQLGKVDDADQGPWLIHCGLVEPAISLDDAREFWSACAPELGTFLVNAINDLSGLAEGAQKSD